MSYSPSESLGAEKSERVKGLVTGVKNKVLGITGNTWLKTVTYFDKKYNAIQTVKQLYPREWRSRLTFTISAVT